MINEESLEAYLKKEFGGATDISIKKLGSGVHGGGFLIEMTTPAGLKSFVIKGLVPKDFGHEYPSDRAGIFLLGLDEYKNLPKHVRAVDVLAETEDGSIRTIGGGKEYYLLMEKGEGRDYFHDLAGFSKKRELEAVDIEKIKALTSYLSDIHSKKRDSKSLYWRKIRDTIGHGECLMGVLDTYPEGILSYKEMAKIEKKAVDWKARLKPKFKRLSQIHGDFHPGNILFPLNDAEKRRNGETEKQTAESFHRLTAPRYRPFIDFTLLDRSRGPWGEPADDVTALTINYIFFSIKYSGAVRGAYLEGLRLFCENYIRLSGDEEILSVVQPFYAFRGVVVANPVFYPDITSEQRKTLFRFVNNVLDSEEFDVTRVNEYLK